MPSFNISGGASTTFTDTTPDGGVVIDFTTLDNSFGIQVNGVDLFVGGPAGAPNEAQFQIPATQGQTVRFADGTRYEIDTPAIWQLGNSDGSPVVRLEIYPDGTISFYGVKADNGPLEPLELFNGMTVNTAAIDAAWNDTGTNDITISQIVTGPTVAIGEYYADLLCFAAGTWIETQDGCKRVEDLVPWDMVRTYDNGFQPVRWIGAFDVSPAHLAAEPRLTPVVIHADALGGGFPQQDLVVSRQHRVLVSSVIAQRMFGTRDVLIPACKLLPLPGVELLENAGQGVRYFHILFDRHELIWSNGMPTESLFTGPEALKSVSPDARQEIMSLFPELCAPNPTVKAARLIPDKGKQMRKLVARHCTNKKPLMGAGAE